MAPARQIAVWTPFALGRYSGKAEVSAIADKLDEVINTLSA